MEVVGASIRSETLPIPKMLNIVSKKLEVTDASLIGFEISEDANSASRQSMIHSIRCLFV